MTCVIKWFSLFILEVYEKMISLIYVIWNVKHEIWDIGHEKTLDYGKEKNRKWKYMFELKEDLILGFI